MAPSLDVAAWRYRKEIRVEKSGVQQFDLDLEILSHSNRDFSDLRLVQNNGQFPYLLENTSAAGKVEPAVTGANDPENPKISRWILKLPFPSLPIRELFCTSQTLVFKRSVRLYENHPDVRGNSQERALASGEWIKAAGNGPQRFCLALTQPPQTDTLILETDNGENPPVHLQRFELHYPVSRVIFTTPKPSGFYLYYGNPDAAVPRYDIELVAQQMLQAEKTVVHPGREEKLREPGIREKATSNPGIIFWIALVIAVIVLFFVVSRLLPK